MNENLENDLKVFFDGFKTYYDLILEYRKEMDLKMSTAFTPFNYIHWDERMISRIFKDIIIPCG